VGPEAFFPRFFFAQNLKVGEFCRAPPAMMNEIDMVLPLAEPLAESMGYEILRAEMVSEHGNKILRVYLDKTEGGVTLEDCEQFSRALGPILDVESGLQGRYHLEVSSPGLNRPLQSAKHFLAQKGKIIQVHTENDIEGRRNFKGELLGVEGGTDGDFIEIRVDGRDFKIPIHDIKKAHLDFFATEEKLSGPKKGIKGKKK
jgi:ribosome maturation factor RimP